ncbi:TPA: hypothetical protein N0F65_002455 [Lagenidium giganteum]|uniref:Fibronectin type-III domain-containing protein n=1 Tax=Lagenidium giganteum TaxID=4803 RepID=A0AAV2YPG0_9STRA|nr:TPA: hypothetical protein N0F65_002455 [Lagenidium giganteum]
MSSKKGYEAFGSFHTPSIDSLFASATPCASLPAIVRDTSPPSSLLVTPNVASDPNAGSSVRAINRAHFLLDLQEWTFINHGAFGGTTVYAASVANAWRLAAEAQPLRFFDRELFPFLVDAIKALAAFLRVNDAKELVLVPNATAGLHAVLAAVVQAEGATAAGEDPVVVCLSTRYGAVRKMLQSMENAPNQRSLRVNEVPLPLLASYDDRQVLQRLEASLQALRASEDERCVLAVIDHVTSNTGVLLPVRDMVRLCHKYNVPVLVDGAHGLLNLPLDLKALGADYYVGNCHKWFASPKGAAFLHVNKRHGLDATQATDILPRVVSHGFFDGFQSAFMWTGLQDYSAWLSLPLCVEYWRMQGVERCRQYMHDLAQAGTELLLERWSLADELAAAKAMPAQKRHAMRLVRLPPRVFGIDNAGAAKNTSTEAKVVQDTLHHKFKIEVPVKCVEGVLYVRISAHMYNTLDDYVRLADPQRPQDYSERAVSAQLTGVTSGNPGSADVDVFWDSFASTEIGDAVIAYEVQVTPSGSARWTSLTNASTGTIASTRMDRHEKQVVWTRADAGQTIADGFFRLTLIYAGRNLLDMHQRTITPQISFDASEAVMKAALESIETITNVQVNRTGPSSDGGYQWTILFDPHNSDVKSLDHGALPMLVLYQESITAQWSGPGDQVTAEEIRRGEVQPVMCPTRCWFGARGLLAGVAYAFRTRALYATMGWSAWSRASDAVQTPSTVVPRVPLVPEQLQASISFITVRWRMPVSDIDQVFPVLAFHLQQKCDQDLVWQDAQTNVTPGQTDLSVASSTWLPPNTSCVFRVRAQNANGWGTFSAASMAMSTPAAPPSAPRGLRILRNPLRLVWMPPMSSGGSAIVRYEVQLRAVESSTWTLLPDTSVDATKGVCVFPEDLLTPYSSYTSQIRAWNAIGASPFAASSEFLTDYRATPPASTPSAPMSKPNGTVAVLHSAHRFAAANTIDHYYVQGIGNGGRNQSDGQHGVVLLFPLTLRGDQLHEQDFFFTGRSQRFIVPTTNGPMSMSDTNTDTGARIVALDVLAWGAGGGSGGKSSFGDGGGGAFARGVFRVSAGDVVDILVGGGGQGYANGFKGGFNGGADGGIGDFGGAGGGGASEVRINGKTVIIAAGGGGGGSTDYCCAHGGGAGAGGPGESGLFPNATDIPLDNSITGIPRDEYHSQFDPTDTRDYHGLPARHTHLDWGVAGPDANYNVLATGGSGALVDGGGLAGIPSSYIVSRFGKCFVRQTNPITFVTEINAPLAAFSASSGRRMVGGKGQDGHHGGGGGGGGYFGGGGGGSGVDGAGGGGGSSFLSYADLFQRTVDNTLVDLEPVRAFSVQATTSTSVQLTWSSPTYGFSREPMGFVVEMANRSSSEDFRVIAKPTADARAMSVTGLTASAWYRFRVKTLFRDAFAGTYSDVVTFQMPPTPSNHWHRVKSVRPFSELTTHAGLRYTDNPPARRQPSARRGHALAVLDNFVYLYGGNGIGYACNQAHKEACYAGVGVNSELWRFDPEISMWLEIPISSVWPPAREKHSLAVVANRLLLFGGKGDLQRGNLAVNDLWELTLSSTTGRQIATLNDLETALPVQDGKQTFTIGNAGTLSDMCIVDLEVHVNLTHSCFQTLQIELFGPGPSIFPERQQSTRFPVQSQFREVTWSDPLGFGLGTQRTTPRVPNSRAYPVTLVAPEQNGDVCLSGSQTLVFASVAQSSSPKSSFEPLSVFRQLPARGGWTLSITDIAVDGNEGSLDSWDITFSLTPCVPTFTWRNLANVSSGKPPSPRYQHAAIVYQNSMFVFGGQNGANARHLTDLYRLDYTPGGTNTWVTLLPVAWATEKRFFWGRTLLLTPYELLSVGKGITTRRTDDRPHRLSNELYVGRKSMADPAHGWTMQPVVTDDDDDASRPLPRYLGDSVYFHPGADPSMVPRVFVFGGEDDTTLLNDFWQLDLNLLAESEPLESIKARRRRICDVQFANSQYQQRWKTTCGPAATFAIASAAQLTPCSLDRLLLYAWCTETYQTIHL